MVTEETMVRAFSQLIQQHHAQACEMVGGMQRRFTETMQGMLLGTHARGEQHLHV